MLVSERGQWRWQVLTSAVSRGHGMDEGRDGGEMTVVVVMERRWSSGSTCPHLEGGHRRRRCVIAVMVFVVSSSRIVVIRMTP